MKKTVLTLALLGGLSFPNGAFAQDMTKEDVQGIIKEFIKDNPEVILDAVESYGREQQAADIRARQEAVKEHLGWLENNDMLPIAGNPDGDVTMVEFFDYNCGYCKKALDDVMTLIEEDKNLKVVFVEMPILGPSSQLAARWAMAAKEQDAYLEYHIALMEHRGMINESVLSDMAEKIGLDVEQMKQDAKGDKVMSQLDEKTSKGAEMGINGTPAFIIDGELYGGYIGLDTMRQAVSAAREEA